MPPAPATVKVQKTIDKISALYLSARKVYIEFARETGRLIVEVEQDGEVRAAYGAELIPKISLELTKKFGQGFSVPNLRKMRQFFLLHQKHSPASELDWTDYVKLLPVKDEKSRRLLEARILKEDLDSKEIRKLVQAVRHVPAPEESSKLPPLKRPTDLRLNRGIDCPELGTPEGERAKAYVMKLLPVGSTIVLKSHKTKTDTHGRFVVDVFFKTGENDPEIFIKEGIYLNQHLLDEGHAVRMKE